LAGNNLIQKLKKMWVMSFTRWPYKIERFSQLYTKPIGESLNVAEDLSAILLKETGSTIYYPQLAEAVNNKLTVYYVQGKERYLISGIFKEPDRYIYSVSNGCLLGPWGLVYDKDKRTFINESAKEWFDDLKDSPFTNILNFPERVKLKGITISCLTNGADAGFYHFLFESIIKIYFFKQVIDNADFILFNGPVNDWKLKWINRAGINTDKIIWVNNAAHYECDQLIFSSRLINDQQISNWCVNALKSLFCVSQPQAATSSSKKVILISRKGFIRDIQWEELILSSYPEIERIYLSSLSDDDTISQLQDATHVIGPHGAGLSNIYLCRPGTKVLEIYPNGKSYQPCYYRISSICDLKYSVIYLDMENAENATSGFKAFKELMGTFLC